MKTLRSSLWMLVAVGIMIFGFTPTQLHAEDGVTIGGAIRYNYFVKSWDGEEANRDKGGDLGFDTFRFNVHAESKGIYLDTEFRFYTMAFGGYYLHHGYIGYDFNDNTKLQLGVSQVPFGLQPYASHNWFFVLPYYAGFEDDYDAGIKVLHSMDDVDFAIAYYKNAENPGAGNSRYSVDIIPSNPTDYTAGFNNEEVHQFNVRAAYHLQDNIEVGASAQYGFLYNASVASADNGDTGWGSRYAYAVHFDGTFGQANLKAEYIGYKFSPDNGGASTDVVTMGSYGAAYNVASEGSFVVGGVSYDLPFKLGPLGFTAYNDYSIMMKANDNYENSQANTTGFIVKAGGIWSYVDFILGKNHPWVGPNWTNGLAAGNPNADWEYRFNINLAYYF